MHLQEVVFLMLLFSRFCAPSAINGSSPLTLSQANAVISFGEKTTNLAEKLVDAASSDRLLNSIKILSSTFGFAGNILGLANAFIPDQKHQQVLREMTEIKTKIDTVRDDIENLWDKIEWQGTKLQYANAITKIKKGIRYVEQIPNGNSLYREELRDHCREYEGAIDILFEGLLGTGFFRNDIFRTLYDFNRGDITEISKLSERMIMLVTGGLTTVLTCQAMNTNLTSAKDHVDKFYSGKIDNVKSKIAEVLKKCKDNFKGNAQEDLEKVIASYSSRGNSVLARILRGKLSERYPWLNFTAIVYDSVYGGDKHTIDNSNAIYKLRLREKCAIAFYTEKENAGMNRSVENNVESYASKVASQECLEWMKRAWWGTRCLRRATADAESAYDAMAAYLRNYYDYYGLACFDIPENNDLQCEGCDSVTVINSYRTGTNRKCGFWDFCDFKMIIIVL